jgi:hypothetical protein
MTSKTEIDPSFSGGSRHLTVTASETWLAKSTSVQSLLALSSALENSGRKAKQAKMPETERCGREASNVGLATASRHMM